MIERFPVKAHFKGGKRGGGGGGGGDYAVERALSDLTLKRAHTGPHPVGFGEWLDKKTDVAAENL